MDQATSSPSHSAVSNPPAELNASQRFDIDRDLLRRNRIIAGYESCPYVDAYKVLRTRILRKMREHGWNTLAVTGPNNQSGKTITAINLAVAIASEVDRTALLVDANLRNPSIHQYFGLSPKRGLADYILDRIPAQIMYAQLKGIDGLTILPGNRALPDSAEMLSSPQMAHLSAHLKQEDAERIVIYDLPALNTSDALSFAPLVDAVLLVIEAGTTTEADLVNGVEHLQGVPIIGTVLTKAETA